MRYNYTFNVWPDDSAVCGQAIYKVFRLLNTRVEMIMTEIEFICFRESLLTTGFTMRAIVRVPYQEPEVVL